MINTFTPIDTAAIIKESYPLQTRDDLDPLMERIGDARYVLLGEATHGTHEYYTWRAEISRRLIQEKGFSFIAVEGDWPDCFEINRWIKEYPGAGGTIKDVLHQFDRWPTWMWANWEIAALAQWMQKHNSKLDPTGKWAFTDSMCTASGNRSKLLWIILKRKTLQQLPMPEKR